MDNDGFRGPLVRNAPLVEETTQMSDYKSNTPTSTAKPAEKPAEKSTITMDSDAFKSALKEALTEGMAMAAMVASKNAPPPAPMHPRLKAQLRVANPCPECRQDKAACKGKHKKVCVFPRDSRWARYFQGVWLNGVLYRSSRSGEMVTVPASSEIERLVHQWEDNEVQVSTGRQRQHHTGSVQNPNRNVPYFR